MGDLVLSGVLRLEGVGELVERLRVHIQGAERVQVDLSGVTDVDTAVLQVFVAARRTAEQSGKRLLFLSASETVQSRLRLTGLEFLCSQKE